MNAARTTQQIDSPGSLRDQRGAAAVVAQYIHDLSDRHAGAWRESGGRRAAPNTDGVDHDSEPELTAQEARDTVGAR
jgi:hypothetical protein